jgi:2-(1,2-epoxy-1,2-dihydrophenyl)acetyl-CoA isomerase
MLVQIGRMSGQVLFSRHGPVGLVTLNRPEKLNAFADGMRDELTDVVQSAGEDQAIRSLVITGAGRAFCAGADVARMYELVMNEDWDALGSFIDAGARVVQCIADLDKPVLAAVNGAAAGGGANLALACDIRIAATSASIGQTFCRLGLHPVLTGAAPISFRGCWDLGTPSSWRSLATCCPLRRPRSVACSTVSSAMTGS